MNKNSIIIGIIFLFTISCNKVDRIYENKDFLLESFNGTDFFKRGRTLFMSIQTDSINYEYWFQHSRESDSIVLNDSCKKLISFNSPYNEKEVLEKLKSYMEILNRYHIKGVTSKFSEQGITLKFYLKDKDVFYVEDVNNVTIKSWKSYVNSANKLDENWYWREIYSD